MSNNNMDKIRKYKCVTILLILFCVVSSIIWYRQNTSRLHLARGRGYPSNTDKKVLSYLRRLEDHEYTEEEEEEEEEEEASINKVPLAFDWVSWREEQRRRREGIQRACRGIARQAALENLLKKKRGLANLLVDDKHEAIYCYIPKVACSNWKRVWLKLTGLLNNTKVNSIPQKKVHTKAEKMILKYDEQPMSAIRAKLTNYTKMIVVRHPFERLLSAYRDKIHPVTGNRAFQKPVLKSIKKFRENATLSNLQWSDFVDYVTRGGFHKNEHWKPYEDLCHPCAFQYDVIIQFETLTEDSEKFLRLIGAPRNLHLSHVSPSAKLTDNSMLEKYMKQLSPKQLTALYETFKRDFQLFQYN